jgi:hypothetical protein
MVALNVALTAFNGFCIVRLVLGRHDSHSFEVVKVLPTEEYLQHFLHGFGADIQHFNTGFSKDVQRCHPRPPLASRAGGGAQRTLRHSRGYDVVSGSVNTSAVALTNLGD